MNEQKCKVMQQAEEPYAGKAARLNNDRVQVDPVTGNVSIGAQQAEPVLQTCNCRWDGEVQVQQCTLHEAHIDAIHEWAERAKVAERKLARQAEPVEPVAWVNVNHLQGLTLGLYGYVEIYTDESHGRIPLYTAPPQRKPLMEEEIAAEWQKASECASKSEGAVTTSQFVQMFARAVERAHGIKE